MRDRWTDARLDDLNGKVDDGFRRMDERFNRIDERFNRIDERFDALQRTMVQCFVALSAATVTGFVAAFTMIAVQL